MDRIDELKREQNDGHWNLIRFRSDAYDAYEVLEQTVFKDGALSTKTKELMAVGIAIQAGCEADTQKHLERAAKQGASFEESVEAIEVGIVMGGSAAVAYSHFAFHTLDRLYSREILKI